MATRKVKAGAGSTAKKSTAKRPATAAKPVASTKSETVVTTKTVSSRATSAPAKDALFSGSRFPFVGSLIAELLGTFILTTVVIITKGEPLYILFALVAIVLGIGAISGAHVNPLITVGAWVTRKIKGVRAISYLAAQILGSMLALVVLSSFIKAAPQISAQAAMLGQSAATLFTVNPITEGKEWYVFFAEMLGAFLFSFLVAAAMRMKKDRISTAFTVGTGLFLGVLIAGIAASYGQANAIVNPAVAFAVGGITWSWANEGWWSWAVYVFAPLLGGILGFILHDLLRVESDGGDDHLVTE